MRGNLVETLIGAIVLIVAAVFITFAYNRADVGAVEGYELFARFDRVDGVEVGSDVLLSGIKVGTVVGIVLDRETYLAEMRFSIDEAIELPEDTSAEVGSGGLLGDKFIALVPGGAEEMLSAGGEIKFTQGSVDIIALLGRAIFSSSPDDN
jgi:phospholipid/cholesterol/gamma-HCH transport system substrate-binding protein